MDCWCEIIAITILGYWVLCRCLRWKRAAYIANKFQGREPYSLSIDEAQWIVLQFFQYEMPLPSRFSTAFALFRTYGIDSIAKTLIKTTQLADRKVGGKRYADTAVLISEFLVHPIDSDRHALAVARVNWLHSHYTISNDDKLYTLSVFVTCVQRWLEKYEWRSLSTLELTAYWILWRHIGHSLHIDNIPSKYEEIRSWADSYEKRTMLPSSRNHNLAETTTQLFLYNTPHIIKPFAKKLLIGFMDDILREAMMYPAQPRYIHTLINGFFMTRRFFLRNFCLPRLKPLRLLQHSQNEFGRYNVNFTDNEPWYMSAESTGMIKRVMNTLLGNPNPSAFYHERGYLVDEVGPTAFERMGKEKMYEEAAEITEKGRMMKAKGGCPLGF